MGTGKKKLLDNVFNTRQSILRIFLKSDILVKSVLKYTIYPKKTLLGLLLAIIIRIGSFPYGDLL